MRVYLENETVLVMRMGKADFEKYQIMGMRSVGDQNRMNEFVANPEVMKAVMNTFSNMQEETKSSAKVEFSAEEVEDMLKNGQNSETVQALLAELVRQTSFTSHCDDDSCSCSYEEDEDPYGDYEEDDDYPQEASIFW